LALAALEKIVIDRPDPDAPVAANPHRRPERAAMVREFPVGRSASPVIVHESGVSSNATPDLTRIIRQADEEADPEQSRRNLGTILKNQGMRLNNAGNHFEAIRRLQKAGAYTPEDKDLNYLIGQAFHKAGQPAVAVEYYRKVDSGQYVGVARNAVKRAEEQARKMAQKQAKPRY
ncbi:MAG: hypothetical protein ACKV2V_06845, partial [Blastocatellia bacterium]